MRSKYLKGGPGFLGNMKGMFYAKRNAETLEDMRKELGDAVKMFEVRVPAFSSSYTILTKSISGQLQGLVSILTDLARQGEYRRGALHYSANLCVVGHEEQQRILNAIPQVPAGYRSVSELKSEFLEGTREELFKELDLWLAGQFPQDSPKRFYFLSGGAGLGKSSIAHHFCSLATSESKPVSLGGSFFFVRGSLESARSFFPTIAHQLALSQPWLCPYIVSAARKYIKYGDDQQIQYGFDELLRKPLIDASRAANRPSHPVILVVDGLDECKDRDLVPELLGDLLELVHHSDLSWLQIFVASRPEPHIMGILPTQGVSDTVYYRSLDSTLDKWSEDVRRYLEITVSKIAPYREYLNQHPDDLETLIRRAGGVFVYARIAVRFLEMYQDWPDRQFERLLRSTKGAGLSSLDQLYLQVLEQAFPPDDLRHTDFTDLRDRLRSFLQVIVLAKRPLQPSAIALLCFKLSEPEVIKLVDRLRSVLLIHDDGTVVPLHATLTEFLLDDQRCINALYAVDKKKGNAEIVRMMFDSFPRAIDNVINRVALVKGQGKPRPLDDPSSAWGFMSYMQGHWTYHLSDAEYGEELIKQLQAFMMSPGPTWLCLLLHRWRVPNGFQISVKRFLQVRTLLSSCYPITDIHPLISVGLDF